MSKKEETIQFQGYQSHAIPQLKQFDVDEKRDGEHFQEDLEFGNDRVKYQQLDERLRILEQQFARLCRDADNAINRGMTNEDYYQSSGNSYQQAKINGIKYQFSKLNEEN